MTGRHLYDVVLRRQLTARWLEFALWLRHWLRRSTNVYRRWLFGAGFNFLFLEPRVTNFFKQVTAQQRGNIFWWCARSKNRRQLMVFCRLVWSKEEWRVSSCLPSLRRMRLLQRFCKGPCRTQVDLPRNVEDGPVTRVEKWMRRIYRWPRVVM